MKIRFVFEIESDAEPVALAAALFERNHFSGIDMPDGSYARISLLDVRAATARGSADATEAWNKTGEAQGGDGVHPMFLEGFRAALEYAREELISTGAQHFDHEMRAGVDSWELMTERSEKAYVRGTRETTA